MGKRSTGETITIVKAGRTTKIARLGHGEGYGIAHVFRDTVNERARYSPAGETQPDSERKAAASGEDR
jgi:hypothetical protein